MKQKLLFLLTALCFGVVSGVKADVTVPDPVYFNDFSSTEGLTVVGNGVFEDDADARFGKIFHNDPNNSNAVRTNYLQLPSTVFKDFTTNGGKTAMTIGLWVNKKNEDNFFWTSLFAARLHGKDDAQYGSNDNYPTLTLETRCIVDWNYDNCQSDYWVADTRGIEGATAHSGGTYATTAWLDDGQWHYYTMTLTGTAVKVYVDGIVKDSWTLDGTAGKNLSKLFTNASELTNVTIGGNQAYWWNDPDPAFGFDDFAVYDEALSAAQIQKIIFDKDPAAAANKEVILAAKGDATSLVVNPTFDENADGWSFSNDHGTTGSKIDRYNGSSWRGGNNYYVDCNNRWYTITQTIKNMPAGTYKLVAAMRGKGFGIRPSVAGTDGAYWYGTNKKMINKNGVVMPVTDITKREMNYANDGTQWNWVSVTGKLETNGDLTIAFKLEANNNCWACLDDVHLYYMSDGENSYAHSLGEVSSNVVYNNTNNVITKDVIVTNPNVIITTNVTVETAMGQLNNNLVSGTVANLVLYDGNEFSVDDDFTATNAKLYRSVTSGGFATVCAPFAISSASGTFYEPTKFTNNVLTFGEQGTPGAGKAYLFKASADVTEMTGAGEVKANPVDNGTGVVMKGTYNRIATIDHDNYILSSGTLYKVDSDVSLNPFRAYFNIPSGDLSPARLVINLDDFTGINVVDATEAESDTMKDGKYIENNQLFIVKNGVKYSANGQILK